MELFLKNAFLRILLFVFGRTKSCHLKGCLAIEISIWIWSRKGTRCADAYFTLLTSEGCEMCVVVPSDDFRSS